jgi:hypothetical protein
VEDLGNPDSPVDQHTTQEKFLWCLQQRNGWRIFEPNRLLLCINFRRGGLFIVVGKRWYLGCIQYAVFSGVGNEWRAVDFFKNDDSGTIMLLSFFLFRS